MELELALEANHRTIHRRRRLGSCKSVPEESIPNTISCRNRKHRNQEKTTNTENSDLLESIAPKNIMKVKSHKNQKEERRYKQEASMKAVDRPKGDESNQGKNRKRRDDAHTKLEVNFISSRNQNVESQKHIRQILSKKKRSKAKSEGRKNAEDSKQRETSKKKHGRNTGILRINTFATDTDLRRDDSEAWNNNNDKHRLLRATKSYPQIITSRHNTMLRAASDQQLRKDTQERLSLESQDLYERPSLISAMRSASISPFEDSYTLFDREEGQKEIGSDEGGIVAKSKAVSNRMLRGVVRQKRDSYRPNTQFYGWEELN